MSIITLPTRQGQTDIDQILVESFARYSEDGRLLDMNDLDDLLIYYFNLSDVEDDI